MKWNILELADRRSFHGQIRALKLLFSSDSRLRSNVRVTRGRWCVTV